MLYRPLSAGCDNISTKLLKEIENVISSIEHYHKPVTVYRYIS